MKKSKLFLSLMSLCFALAVLCFGVYAANQVNYTLSGSVSYEVSDAYVTVTTRVYKGAYRSAEDVYESIEGMAFDGDVPGEYDYTLDTDISIPNYSSLTTNADFEQEDIDISMNAETAVYVFELTITNIGDINVWVEPKPNWSETLNIYQADSGVTTELAQDETVKTYIILAVDNPIASVVGGDYSVGVNIGAGDCPINNEYYSFETVEFVEGFEMLAICNVNPPEGVIIPSYIDGEIVGYVPGEEFCENESITSVYVPGTFKFLGDFSFGDCPYLIKVRIEKGLNSIQQISAFIGSGITDFRFPNTFDADYEGTIVGGLYDDYDLNTPWFIDLWDSNNPNRGIATASDGVTTYILAGIGGLTTLDYTGKHIDYICANAFQYCESLSSIVLPNGVKSICNHAFYDCTNLQEINIPESVSFLGESSFEDCTSLEEVTILSNVPIIIKSNAFRGCTSLESVTLPDTVIGIQMRAFEGTPWLADYDEESGLKIANGKYLIGANKAKYFGNISSTDLAGITLIACGAFHECTGLVSIELPNSVTYLGYEAFSSCSSLESVTLSNAITVIEYEVFSGCQELTSINIPASVTSIYHAFHNCSSLTSITINATTPPTLRVDVFNNTNNCPIYVPSASVDAYKSAEGWSSYASRIQAISN